MCGRKEAVLPIHYWVDLASLKDAPDAFRLGDAVTRIIVSERFAEVISRLDPSDVVLTPIPTSRPPDGKPQPPGCIPFRPG
jgi:hypothetical protein